MRAGAVCTVAGGSYIITSRSGQDEQNAKLRGLLGLLLTMLSWPLLSLAALQTRQKLHLGERVFKPTPDLRNPAMLNEAEVFSRYLTAFKASLKRYHTELDGGCAPHSRPCLWRSSPLQIRMQPGGRRARGPCMAWVRMLAAHLPRIRTNKRFINHAPASATTTATIAHR